MLVGARILFALLLGAVQLYVGRAMSRIVRSTMLPQKKERIALATIRVLLCVINLPLIFFIIESAVRPRELLLYAPPLAYEPVMRPVAYIFFVWTLDSLLFSA